MEFHKNCTGSLKMITDIPKLLKPFESMKSNLLDIQ